MAANDHRRVQLKRGDTVILSATPIPATSAASGAPSTICSSSASTSSTGSSAGARLGARLSRRVLLMLNLARPKYFMPVHGEYRMLVQHARLAERTGIPADNISCSKTATSCNSPTTRAARRARSPAAPCTWTASAWATSATSFARPAPSLGRWDDRRDGDVDSVDGKVLAGPDITSRGFT